MAMVEQYEQTSIATNWWGLILRGVAAILFGLAAIGWPAITLTVLLTLFGIFVLVDGVLAFVTAINAFRMNTRVWPHIIEGLVGVGVGIAVFLVPDLTARALLLFIALWAMTIGAFKIISSIELRSQMEGLWMLALSGILSILFGVFLLAFPAEGALAFVLIIGMYSIIAGSLLIALGLYMRNQTRMMEKYRQELPYEEEEKRAA